MIKKILLIFSILSFVIGWSYLGIAKSAVHEIASFILFAIFAIFLSGYGIIVHIDKLKTK